MEGTITRRQQLMVTELYDAFKTLVGKEVFDKALANLRKAGNRSDRPSKLKILYSLLDRCGVEYKEDQSCDYYGQLIRELHENGVILPHRELDGKMLAEFFKASLRYASPQTYLERLVDRLTDRRWGNDSLRLKILKQFIAEGNALSYKKKGESGRVQTVYIYKGEHYLKEYAKRKLGRKPASPEELIAAMDDGVFDALEGASRDDLKPDGKYGLLKMISDLSSGLFRKGGNTKRALYLFAIVFRMTFYAGEEDAGDQWQELPVMRDEKTDIELNLFVDFYCNNVIRFMQEPYDKVRLMQVDTDPSGQGINYKNYAENVYLYYLSRPDMEPAEKLRASNEMLLEIERRRQPRKESDEETGEPLLPPAPAEVGTAFYRQNVRNPKSAQYSIFAMSEEELLNFLCLRYQCDRGQKGFMQLSAEQNTAYGIYRELRRRLAVQLKCLERNLFNDYDVTVTEEETERYLKSCQDGLWFCDPTWCSENVDSMSAIIAPFLLPEVYPRETYERFARMLLCCQNILGSDGMPSRLLFVDSPELITRSALLTVYYYYFNAHQALTGDIEDMCFEEVFNTFGGFLPEESALDILREEPAGMKPDDGLNALLAAAYYQPVSGKNILDVMTVFSSYRIYGL